MRVRGAQQIKRNCNRNCPINNYILTKEFISGVKDKYELKALPRILINFHIKKIIKLQQNIRTKNSIIDITKFLI
jgi:hypothetical protein